MTNYIFQHPAVDICWFVSMSVHLGLYSSSLFLQLDSFHKILYNPPNIFSLHFATFSLQSLVFLFRFCKNISFCPSWLLLHPTWFSFAATINIQSRNVMSPTMAQSRNSSKSWGKRENLLLTFLLGGHAVQLVICSARYMTWSKHTRPTVYTLPSSIAFVMGTRRSYIWLHHASTKDEALYTFSSVSPAQSYIRDCPKWCTWAQEECTLYPSTYGIPVKWGWLVCLEQPYEICTHQHQKSEQHFPRTPKALRQNWVF